MAAELRNRDVTLLIIAAAGDSGLTPIQVMKSAFVIGRSGLPDLPTDFYPFFAYNYGPFHPAVYRDTEELVSEKLVFEVAQAGRKRPKYTITATGLQYAETLKRQVASEFFEYTEAVVNWVKSLNFIQLLRAIYEKYPEMRANSVFQEG